ncbi:MD-2-related lipid-recognition protein ROSY1-like [Zingiber officinale]|uniref:MD-2-related lipid-recognition domain-containing protein n=1 Tax=Zingiber officinale TaxID=94328 RepID=A0A8J5KSS1_ZINOF|nr:MD-2-related lipid-recognition protein ROSY1-like [Zingiber officinale]KAG6498953.1 hypothetical protein ZIOFF_038706 [Zingiber officinale]
MASVASHRLFSASFSLFFLLLIPRHGASTDFQYCNKEADYPVKVSSVQISPDPIARGKPAKFKITANAGAPISGGMLVIDVKYFGFLVHEETHDLCEETSCPILNSDFILSHQQTLPSYAPPGTYALTMKLIANAIELTCINFDFSIRFASVADI